MTTALNPTAPDVDGPDVVVLDKDTADYYGSDVSSVSNIPEGFNEISREEPYEESDVSSATDGLVEGFNTRAVDDHIGPDPHSIMESVGDGGGGDASPDGALTDVNGNESAYDGSQGTNEGSSTAEEGPSTTEEDEGAPEGGEDDDDVTEGDDAPEDVAPASMSMNKDELVAMADKVEVDNDGTKEELVERINAKLGV